MAYKHFVSVYQNLCRYVGGWLFLIVILVICSLVTLLLSLILPWQLLSVLDGHAMTRWQVPHAEHALLLVATVVVLAFGSHLLCEWAIKAVGRRGGAAMLAAHAKVGLQNGHRERAVHYFMILARILSSAILLLVVLGLLLAVYPFLALGVMVYLLACVSVGMWVRQSALLQFVLSTGAFIQAGWQLGFLFILFWVIVGYHKASTPALEWVVVSVIAARQVLVQIFTSLGRLQAVWSNREQIYLLFLPERVGERTLPKPSAFFSVLLQSLTPPYLGIASLLRGVGLSSQVDRVDCQFTDRGHVLHLVATHKDSGGSTTAHLVKLYDASRSALSEHEAALLQEALPSWPAPRLLSQYKEKDYSVLFFTWDARAQCLTAVESKSINTLLRTQILACRIPSHLQAGYDRAHAPLHACWHQEVDWEACLWVTKGEEAKADVKAFRDSQDEISARLRQLPEQIVFTDLPSRPVARAESGQLWLLNWTGWQLGPIGAGWPITTSSTTLKQALKDASMHRPELLSADPVDMGLACLVYALWFGSKHRNFVQMQSIFQRSRQLLLEMPF